MGVCVCRPLQFVDFSNYRIGSRNLRNLIFSIWCSSSTGVHFFLVACNYELTCKRVCLLSESDSFGVSAHGLTHCIQHIRQHMLGGVREGIVSMVKEIVLNPGQSVEQETAGWLKTVCSTVKLLKHRITESGY